jgi:hypothetical protein
VSTNGGEWGVAAFWFRVTGSCWSLLLLNACNRYPPLEKSYERCTKSNGSPFLPNATTQSHPSSKSIEQTPTNQPNHSKEERSHHHRLHHDLLLQRLQPFNSRPHIPALEVLLPLLLCLLLLLLRGLHTCTQHIHGIHHHRHLTPFPQPRPTVAMQASIRIPCRAPSGRKSIPKPR